MTETISRKSLDLGCDDFPRNPYNFEEIYGIDLNPQVIEGFTYVQANLALEAIPFVDNFFDCVTAFDFIEHIPRQLMSLDTGKSRLPFVELMNEIWRVLKPSGIFYAVTPAYPSGAAFQDPTHVNVISNETHNYFCGVSPYASLYGFTGQFVKLRAEPVVLKTALTAEKTTSKSLYNLQKRIFNPRRLSHFLWELRAIK